jgi:hypothetical protein
MRPTENSQVISFDSLTRGELILRQVKSENSEPTEKVEQEQKALDDFINEALAKNEGGNAD